MKLQSAGIQSLRVSRHKIYSYRVMLLQNHESSLKVCSAFFSIILTEQYSLLCTWHTGLCSSGSPGRCWGQARLTIFTYYCNQLSEIINCHGCGVECEQKHLVIWSMQQQTIWDSGSLGLCRNIVDHTRGHSGSFGICRNIRTSDWPTWWMHVGFQLKWSTQLLKTILLPNIYKGIF